MPKTLKFAHRYLEISNQTGNSVEDNFNDLIHIGFTTQLSSYLNLAATWMVFLIISGLLLLILLIILIFMRKSIRIAVELIDLGASAVKSMVSTLFFPVFPFLLQIVVVGWFITVGMYLASAGERQYRLDIDCPDTGEKYLLHKFSDKPLLYFSHKSHYTHFTTVLQFSSYNILH